jgi:hypothetical protein
MPVQTGMEAGGSDNTCKCIPDKGTLCVVLAAEGVHALCSTIPSKDSHPPGLLVFLSPVALLHHLTSI